MYECHVTIEPVFDRHLEHAKSIAGVWQFRVAELLMQKRRDDKPVRSANDTFMTSHHQEYAKLRERMIGLCNALREQGFKVWRYKIEYIMLDSKTDPDELNLLDKSQASTAP